MITSCEIDKNLIFFVNMRPQVFLLTSESLTSISDLDSLSCRACCNYERELWARMDQLDLFKIRIYLKGIPNHKLILFFFPSALTFLDVFPWKEKSHHLFFWTLSVRQLMNQPHNLLTLTLHVKKLRFQSEAANHLAFTLLRGPSIHRHFWGLPVRAGCLEPVASTWRALVRPYVGPWCLRMASRERRPTSPSLSSTPHWWACCLSLTMRCAKHKCDLCSNLQIRSSRKFVSSCRINGTLVRQT